MAAFTPFLSNSAAMLQRDRMLEVLMIKYDTRKFSIPLRENKRESVVLDRSIAPSTDIKLFPVFFLGLSWGETFSEGEGWLFMGFDIKF